MPNVEKDIFLSELENISQNFTENYIYIKSVAKYFWVEKRRFFTPTDVMNNIMCSNKQLQGFRKYGMIQEYDDICYYMGGKEGCYNLLQESKILIRSNIPQLDTDIKHLIENLSGYKKENIEYLHKAILYKYHNPNDFTIPAVVFYGMGGSGKGTFISLLETIFHSSNVLANLGQQDLTSSFDTYKGQKLVVEFAEISTNNTNSDLRILNKLKNIICAEKITVNEKGVQAYQIENIAWFFISSNSNKPLQLDDRDKGNRRFTIIQSIDKLRNGKEINKSVRDTEKVANYLAWLYQEYPEVIKYKKLDALDNEDKRELEERSQSEANQFWEWFEDKYPNAPDKITHNKVEEYIEAYCFENVLDNRTFMKYFWSNSKYPKKKIRIEDKTYYGVQIRQNNRTLEHPFK